MDDPDVVRNYGMSGGPAAGMDLTALTAASAQIDSMRDAVRGMKTALQDFSQSSYRLADQINRHLKSIGDTATATANALGALSGAATNTPGTTDANAVASPTKGVMARANQAAGWVSNAGQSINKAVNKPIAGGLSLGTFLGNSENPAADLVMAPLRFLRDRINTNRETAIQASGGLTMQAMQQFKSGGTASMMSTMAKFPGSIYGTAPDMVSMFGNAPSLGASYNFGGREGGEGVRAKGFFKGVREMQMLNPMANVGGEGGIVDTLGGYASNTGAQQKAMMLTGGAMGMIAVGGRQKSLGEWAESILRWFEAMRPGKDKGKGFDYGELMAQYFPGSNIDAWFNATGVTQAMKDYWWTYALGKANRTPDTRTKGFEIGTDKDQMGPGADNVAWQRLRAGSEITRTEFGLAGKMSGQYANREGSNRWFNELLGQVMNTIIPMLSKGPLAGIQFLPDAVEDLLMTGTERGMGALLGKGDIGDIGDSYGDMGGTGLSGLHPDVKTKVGAMMRANPRIKVNSGLRDTGLQQRLKAKGHSRVSGKPSAHTRGMAVDLGPRSEYGWISRNAGKFGLASGKGHGEPWHVGMKGDIPGLGDVDIGEISDDPLKDFLGLISGGNTEEGMAGIISTMLGWMTKGIGKLAGGSKDDPDIQADPDALYRKLVGFSKAKPIIGKTSGGGATNTTSPTYEGAGRYANGTGATAGNQPLPWEDIVRAAYDAGFRGLALQKAVAITGGESGRIPTRHNPVPPDDSYGLWQINMMGNMGPDRRQRYGLTDNTDLYDPRKNAEAAWDISAHGANFNPWTVYKRGVYQQYMDEAQSAMTATGLGDIEAMQAMVNMPARPGGSGVSFNNTFNLSVPTYGSGGSGGIDVRQTVTLIADHLEAEMSRRMKRSA